MPAEIPHAHPGATPSGLAALLDDRTVFVIGGTDAPAFLQNMTTCDVRKVTPERGGPGSICTNKGRVIAYFHLLRRGDEYLLILPRAAAAPAAEFLRRMIFRSKVTLQDAGDALAVVGWAGPEAAQVVAERAGRTLGKPGDAAASSDPAHGFAALRLPGAVPRFEIVLPRAAALALTGPAGSPDTILRAKFWEIGEVLVAGEPAVYPETSEAFLPQFLDLDRRGGLSFTKGCFPGQEVVARTQHLGEVKRRLALARVPTDDVPAPGTPLRALRDDGERDGGTVVRAAATPQGGVALLAVVPVAERDAQRPIHLGTADGPALEFLELPAGWE